MAGKAAGRWVEGDGMFIIIIVAFLILAGIGIRAGYTDRAVFFHGVADVVVSFSMVLIVPIALAILLQPDDGGQLPAWVRQSISILLVFGALAYQIHRSFWQDSDGFTKLCVLCGRLLVSALGILVFFSSPSGRDRKHYLESALASTIVWAAILAGSTLLIRKLMNRERVYARKRYNQ